MGKRPLRFLPTIQVKFVLIAELKFKKSLSTRTHICQCGYVEDRDVNAAINILQKGLSTVGHTGTYAWGETSSSLVGAILPGYGDSLNQESNRIYACGLSIERNSFTKDYLEH